MKIEDARPKNKQRARAKKVVKWLENNIPDKMLADITAEDLTDESNMN
jgi:hypothetical protein